MQEKHLVTPKRFTLSAPEKNLMQPTRTYGYIEGEEDIDRENLLKAPKDGLIINLADIGENVYLADKEGASKINSLTAEDKCSFTLHIACVERNAVKDLHNQRTFFLEDSTNQALDAAELNKLFTQVAAANINGPVVFSCSAGVSRSPAVAIAYKLYLLCRDSPELFQQKDANLLVDLIATQVQALSPKTNINHFSRQLVSYAESLKNDLFVSSTVKPEDAKLPPDTYRDRLISLFKEERSTVKASENAENSKYATLGIKKIIKGKENRYAIDWIIDTDGTEKYYPLTTALGRKAGFFPQVEFSQEDHEVSFMPTMDK